MAVLVLLKSPDEHKPQRLIPLTGEPQTIGRDAERCQIVIPHASVSREHARITHENGVFYIEDLKSRNHTYVNGKQITERTPLAADDRIRICDYLFQFRQEVHAERRSPLPPELRKPGPADVTPGDADDPAQPASTIEASQSTDSVPGLLQSAPAERLRALLEISTSLSQTLELEPLLQTIADVLFRVFRQADRCFILLLDEDGRPVPRIVKRRRPHDEDSRYSRTIVRRVIDSRQAFLTEDATIDAQLGPAASIAEFRIRSAMCAPMLASSGQAVGVIQIDTLERHRKFNPDDLNLLTIVSQLAGVALEKARLHQQAIARQREEREIELARQVQLGLLPQQPPTIPGYEFFTYYSPARRIGGDYYDFIPLADGRWAIVLGDVAGKGVPAALLVAKLSSEVRYSLLTSPDPAAAVARLNNQLLAIGLQDRFVTLACLVLDPTHHALTLVNAGHIPPKYYRPTLQRAAPLGHEFAHGLPLGVMPDYPYAAETVQLQPGDVVALYTDGITDALNPDGRLFGDDQVLLALCPPAPDTPASPKACGQRLIHTVQLHAAQRPQNDDIALVCFGPL